MHVSNTPKYYGPALLERENRTSLWGGVDSRSTNIDAKTPYLPHLLSITKRDERSTKFIESRQGQQLGSLQEPPFDDGDALNLVARVTSLRQGSSRVESR